ncbi:DUF4214 domain-containing protein [Pseudoduganella sp. GCM10020061]|uniref:DUF4214 domain-containing protein n=1 Tax=Pseudoduganella sp. GCM10020061 TaxID=3317345 RepID=UPI00363A00A2
MQTPTAAVVLPGNRADYRIERVAGTVQLTHIATSVVTRVASNARIRFADYTLGMDVEGNAGQAYRLYQAAFNRTPDVRGLSFWIQAMDRGVPLEEIAQGFVNSSEFKSVYGINPTPTEIVNRFYNNVLHRDGEPSGVAFWVSVLTEKRASVAAVLGGLNGFSESPENQAGVYGTIGNGIAYREDNVSYVVAAHAGPNRTTSVGAPVVLDGTESIGDSPNLTYSWTIVARPVGSTAQLLNPGTALPTFTPDKVGAYTMSLAVSDSKSSATSSMTVNVHPASLAFAPLDARYSRGLDKIITVSTNPNALKIVDPFSEAVSSVSLPAGVKSFNLSPNGKLAIVLHESVASLVDLEAGTLVKSFATGGSHTDAFLTDAAIAYFIGQSGGQWVRPSVVYFNARTGQDVTLPESNYMGMFYGSQYGIYAPTKNKVFLMSHGLSPADINFFTINPVNNEVIDMGDSPYHGDYYMATPLFLSETEDILFTSMGNYFYTADLRYAGTFSLQSNVLSLSNSAARDETLVLSGWTNSYPSRYHRFTGALFFLDAVYDLPVIEGKQSYGIKIWHSADGRRVALVQTGSSVQNGAGVRYYIVTL